MTVISTHRDLDQLTMTFVAEFAAPPERVWRVWEDPRRLERWWGPPTWPATFEELDFAVGGTARYFMTGPDGGTAHGWWEITAIDAPQRLEFRDGFADPDGSRLDDPAPMDVVVTLDAQGAGTRMVITTRFSSLEHLEQVAEMGVEEGMTEALNQIDALLEAPATQ